MKVLSIDSDTLTIEHNGKQFVANYNTMEVYFDIEILKEFEGFDEANTCKHCEGEGTILVDDCKNNSNECCGGCFKSVPCDCEKKIEF